MRSINAAFFVLILTLTVCSSGFAQQLDSCEASTAVKQAIREWIIEYTYSTKPYGQRMQPIRELLKRYPRDVFIHQAYVDAFDYYTTQSLVDSLIEEYRSLHFAHPDDPLFTYLYGRVLRHRDLEESLALLRSTEKIDPEFPQVHLALAGRLIETDKKTARGYLDRYFKLCPESVEEKAYSVAGQLQDDELLKELASRLRAVVERRADFSGLARYRELWQFEFKLTAANEQSRLRDKVATDLRRIRTLDTLQDPTWVGLILQGYALAGDLKAITTLEDEIISRFPNSYMANSIRWDRWFAAHPRPRMEDTSEAAEAQAPGYYRELAEWTKEETQRAPDYEMAWSQRFSALRELKDSPPAEIVRAATRLLELRQANPDRQVGVGFGDVAQVYLQRHILLDKIPALIDEDIKDAQASAKTEAAIAWWNSVNRRDAYQMFEQRRWGDWEILTELYEGQGQRDKLNVLVGQMETALAEQEQEGHHLGYNRGWPAMVSGYVRAGRLEKAKQLLATNEGRLLADNPPKPALAATEPRRFASVDECHAQIAEHEGRKLDAMVLYQKAALETSRYSPQQRGALFEKAQKLWASLGGTEPGWRAFTGRQSPAGQFAIATSTTSWKSAEQKLLAFELFDVQGNKWRSVDLAGKAILANFWATWCGPCQAEFPHLQKLHEQLRGREDAIVLTFNLDENPGIVEGFLKQRGYTFPALLAYDYGRNALNVNGIPHSWIVAPDGIVRYLQEGFSDEGSAAWVKDTLEKIDRLVKK